MRRALAFVVVAACAHEEGALQLRNVEAPPGAQGTVCFPTGPELCFNATDDNCNGVIDEGCGAPSGLLQWTIAWQDRDADVDLAVTVPSGGRVSASSKNVEAVGEGSLRYDRDCPPCQGQNTENVYLSSASSPDSGEYVVEVTLVDAHGVPPPLEVKLGARIGSKTMHYALKLTPADSRKVLRFRVGPGAAGR